MSLILKQEDSANVPTPDGGKGTLFLNSSDQLAVKNSDGNVSTLQMVSPTGNTQVLFNDNGGLGGDANFTFNKTNDTLSIANLTVTGTLNAGDISVSSIANGTSNLDIIGSNGNVTVSVAGNSNIFTVTGTGANIAGTANISGNANVGNLGTTGLIVSGTSNLGPVGNVTITGGSNGQVLTTNGSGGLSWATSSGGTPGGSNTQIQFNDNGVFGGNTNFTFTTSPPIIRFGSTSAQATIIGAENTGWPLVIRAGNTSNSTNSGGLELFGGFATSTGSPGSVTITGGQIFGGSGTAGNVSIRGGHVASGSGTAGSINFSTNSVVRFNILPAGAWSVGTAGTNTGTSGQVLTSQGSDSPPIWSNVSAATAGTVTTAAQPNITSVGTLTGLTSNGTINFTGASNVSLGAVGNIRITGGSNGQVLTSNGSGGVSWAAAAGTPNLTATQIGYGSISNLLTGSANFTFNGSNTVTLSTSDSPTIAAGVGTTTRATFQVRGVDGQYGTDLIVRSGDADGTGGTSTNGGILTLRSGSGLGGWLPGDVRISTGIGTGTSTGGDGYNGHIIFSTANVSSGSLIERFRILRVGAWSVGTAGTNTGTSGQVLTSQGSGSPPIWSNVSAATATTAETVTTNAQPNITSVGTLTSLAVTGNVTAGNILGIFANGNSNISIPAANGNINISAGGTPNELVITNTGINVAGTLNATGNANVGNLGTTGLIVSGTSNLGPVSNVTITGGSNGQVLSTNGSGVLSWTTPAAGGNVTLTSTEVAFGSGSNTVTSSNNFIWDNANFALIISHANRSNSNVALITTGDANVSGAVAPHILRIRGATGLQSDTIGGNVEITGGSTNSAVRPGGSVRITGGIGNGTNGIGGSVIMVGGNAQASGRLGGDAIVMGGTAGSLASAGNTVIRGGLAPSDGTPGFISFETQTIGNNFVNTERFRILANGAWSVGGGGSNTGTSGQVLTSQGSGSPPIWSSVATAGTVTTAAQPNITSVGTLTSLAVTGNVTAGNVYANSGTIGASLLTGTLTTASQPNITSVGTLSSLSVTGNVTAGNLTGIFANGNSNISIPAANGNINISAGGTPNELVITSTGINVAGTLNATGNANVANIGATNAVFTGNANITNTNLVRFSETVINGGNTGAATLTPNAAAATIYQYTLTGNITLNALSNAVAGTSMTIILTQDSVGNRLLTSTMRFAGGSKTLSTAANSIDIISCFFDGTNYYASLTKGYA